jgi:hypothetical protein
MSGRCFGVTRGGRDRSGGSANKRSIPSGLARTERPSGRLKRLPMGLEDIVFILLRSIFSNDSTATVGAGKRIGAKLTGEKLH